MFLAEGGCGRFFSWLIEFFGAERCFRVDFVFFVSVFDGNKETKPKGDQLVPAPFIIFVVALLFVTSLFFFSFPVSLARMLSFPCPSRFFILLTHFFSSCPNLANSLKTPILSSITLSHTHTFKSCPSSHATKQLNISRCPPSAHCFFAHSLHPSILFSPLTSSTLARLIAGCLSPHNLFLSYHQDTHVLSLRHNSL